MFSSFKITRTFSAIERISYNWQKQNTEMKVEFRFKQAEATGFI